MAEAFSLASSIIGVASAGIKLSTTLYQFTESAINADRAIKDIARDLSLTSSIITRFGTLLGEQATANAGKLRADNNDATLKTARDAVNGCDEVFKEIQKELDKYVDVDADENERRPMVNTLRRLKWPLVQHKFIALHSRLERLKNTLVLTLNVVSYASRTSISEIEPSVVGSGADDQRRQIDRLIMLNEQANARYRGLEKTLERIESMHSPPEATISPYRVDSGMTLTDNDEMSISDPIDAVIRAETEPIRKPTVESSGADEIELETTTVQEEAFRITQQDLSTCAEQARLFLKIVEEAQSSGAQPSQCKEVRKAYFDTFQALQNVFPQQQSKVAQSIDSKVSPSKEPQPTSRGLRRLFSKRLRNS